MNILLTLDYELFLGSRTGSVLNCLINPMNKILSVCDSEDVRMTLFVDASYLYRLSQYRDVYPQLKTEYEMIEKHLKELDASGYDIQLHIHPHWSTSTFNGTEWTLDQDRYKLSDMDEDAAVQFFVSSKRCLDRIVGKKTTVFRAGGFSTQPTSLLTTLFKETGLLADCSVCSGMKYDSAQQKYDYRFCPNKSYYHFQEDICVENPDGLFVEIPVSTAKVSPLFNWKYAFSRIMKMSKHCTFGDGQGVKATKDSVYERLFHRATCIVTMDGFKASLLSQQYVEFKKANWDNMCVIGHPKLGTPYSIEKLGEFIRAAKANGDQFISVSQLLETSTC